MFRWLAAAAALSVLAVPATASAGALDRYVPLVVHDSRERDPLTSVRAFAGRVSGVEPGETRPVVYGRRTGDWLQYWLLFGADTQDRGVLGTGRHAGDWELVQLRLRLGVAPGRPPARAGRARLARALLRPRRARPHLARTE